MAELFTGGKLIEARARAHRCLFIWHLPPDPQLDHIDRAMGHSDDKNNDDFRVSGPKHMMMPQSDIEFDWYVYTHSISFNYSNPCLHFRLQVNTIHSQ
jgi:hypothetical protein